MTDASAGGGADCGGAEEGSDDIDPFRAGRGGGSSPPLLFIFHKLVLKELLLVRKKLHLSLSEWPLEVDDELSC